MSEITFNIENNPFQMEIEFKEDQILLIVNDSEETQVLKYSIEEFKDVVSTMSTLYHNRFQYWKTYIETGVCPNGINEWSFQEMNFSQMLLYTTNDDKVFGL